MNIPTIPNTTITAGEKVIRIKPKTGYALHNSARDWEEELPTGETVLRRGYTTAMCAVPLYYDFENTVEIDGYVAFGRSELFAREKSEVKNNTF